MGIQTHLVGDRLSLELGIRYRF